MTQEALLTRSAEEWLERLTAARRALRPGADPDGDAVERAGRRQRHRRGNRAPGGRTVAPGAAGGAVFRSRRRRSGTAARRWASTPTEVLAELGYSAADIAALAAKEHAA